MARRDRVVGSDPVVSEADRTVDTAAMRLPHRRLSAVVAGALAASLLPAAGVSAASPDFPAGLEGYHTYAEVGAEVGAVAAAHPGIVRRFSLGRSYQGRELWAAKVSDNVAVDENEPEVLYDGGHHSDEHMGVEMALRILGWLADGYGADPRITRIVNSREIWIVFLVNPDGAEYDISGGSFRRWRKNRQPNAGSTYIGTDLNRNYDYRWNSGGRTSDNPQAITYAGPSAFSAPESRAFRDFLASRVVNGRQQIRTHITFHELGRLVMWPYGYTTADLPSDMSADDLASLRTIGRAMAASNGYKPEQASDLYLTSGTTRDYAYGRYRIHSYTFEMSAVDYPDDSLIAAETGRNREAVLYLAERAWCPYSILGVATTLARCGVFDDDLEVGRGWRIDPAGTDTATAGAWRQGNPSPTAQDGAKQLDATPSGRYAFATGLTAGASAGAYDVDGGTTSVETRPMTLRSTAGQRLTFAWTFAHSALSTADDEFRVLLIPASGSAATVFLVRGAAVDRDGAWRTASVALDRWAGQMVRFRFIARDAAGASLVEAAFDDVRVTRPS